MEGTAVESQSTYFLAAAITALLGMVLCLIFQARLRKPLIDPPKPMTPLIIAGYLMSAVLLILSGIQGTINQLLVNVGLILMAAAPALIITNLRQLALNQNNESGSADDEGSEKKVNSSQTFGGGMMSGLRVFIVFWIFYIFFLILFAILNGILGSLNLPV